MNGINLNTQMNEAKEKWLVEQSEMLSRMEKDKRELEAKHEREMRNLQETLDKANMKIENDLKLHNQQVEQINLAHKVWIQKIKPHSHMFSEVYRLFKAYDIYFNGDAQI